MKPSRSSTLARVGALGALALASMVSTSEAAQQCLNPDPKTCKIPEDCFYKRQIAMKRALRDSFASSALRCKAYAAAKKQLGKDATEAQIQDKAGDLLYKDIAGHPGRIAKKLPKCKTSLVDPPSWETGADCVFQAKGPDGKPVWEPESLDTCREFLNASRDHERVHVAACKAERDGGKTELGEMSSWVPHGKACEGASYNQGVPKTPNRKNMNDFADEEADAYTLEVWNLEDERAAAIHRCTTARDAAAAAASASKNAKALKALGGAP